ncbi:MAG: TIGR04283 family arsenosugar biosynthesis glycosyltransferase [Planctomycetota bacterium]
MPLSTNDATTHRLPGPSGPAATASSAPSVSVIIPTWNEAKQLPATIAAATAAGAEIVIVDGGSTDDTVEVARKLGAHVLQTEAGRGRQLAAGATAARGELLLFLHADARLPTGYADQVRTKLADPATAIGAFQLAIDGEGFGLRCIEWGVRRRCRWLKLPYGDQALFVRAATYRQLGGFRDMAAMEDFDFVRRARQLGTVAIVDAPVLTSARAWQQHGLLRTSLFNTVCALLCSFGVAPDRVARWRVRHRLAAHHQAARHPAAEPRAAPTTGHATSSDGSLGEPCKR